jgi:hypothetical protein
MRALPLFCLAFVALVGLSTVQAAAPVTESALASKVANSNEAAVWELRKLKNFQLPLVVNSENGPLQEASCDQLYNTAKELLLQLGARANDIEADMRSCYAYTINRSIDVTFYVLAPSNKRLTKVPAPPVEANWQTVQLNGNCRLLEHATKVILPLFSTRNVKLISNEDCARLGVGLFAQVLKTPQQEPASL